MDAEQYDIMSRSEDRHWWYMGLRDTIGRCLLHPSMQLPPHPSVLDAGCGTGANLHYLNCLLQPSYLAGFDLSELALTHSRRKCPEADIYQSDIRSPILHRNAYDLIVSSDVIYATGIAETLVGLRTLVQALKPGGLCIMNVPAFDWLKSDHDLVVHTRERYTMTRLRKLFDDLDLKCVRLSYRLFSIFPLIVLKRLPSLLWRSRVFRGSELQLPPKWINQILFRILQTENRLISRGTCLPWGSSVFAVARKCCVK